ncbi:kinesin-like protein Klp61F [Cataglyphis hispanica]|uniref:kinesin-like protein Klp61F n=1 Tax=Cataglyphis hispanica TaxID=1086592 RepID=UPI0021807F7C|nr:kinesin-like protein Klp61F [Cataglyphis hispanica]
MNDTRNAKKEKNQHIQVFVRVRPISNTEKVGKSFSVVELPSNKEVIVHERSQGTHSKKFTFDKVFGPSSKQVDVYNAVVSPLLEEVLAGYNCTVFAYGQTGTGKTFTMEGVSNDPTLHWQSDTTAGIIPRALSHLFDELRMLEVQEYTVRVSFLELYNEELFDLLSPNDDASKIRLYEDATRKGSVIIHGLEEVTVHNKNEVYKILEKGSEKRQTAATFMNAHSSRSHTVFSITIHIKENNVDGEELLKTGKLNLVDLAGSENIGRSGAVDRRAREAGNINQSLLTLGRVITALVERAPHIPYRESKLTRLLQESLGGRTKTSIIATVSPANINFEETLSTLDYAHRAKNITNRPEINQKLSKKALLKEYTEEIERLRRDLLAARERNGVYLAQENYNDMQSLIENQNKELDEKIAHIKVLKETMEAKEQIFDDLQAKHKEQTNHLHETKEQLETTTYALKSTTALLEMTEREKEEQSYLVEKHVSTEKELLSQAQILLNVADTVTTDVNKLQEKISYKRQLEQENEHLSHQFRCNITKQFQDMENNVTVYSQNFLQFCTSMNNKIDSQIKLFKKDIDSFIHHMSNDIINKEQLTVDEFRKNTNNLYTHYQQRSDAEKKCSSDMIQREQEFLNDTSLKLTSKINDSMQVNSMQIANNLRHLNNDVSQKFDKLLAYTTESIKQLCNHKIQECNNLRKNIDEIKQNIQVISERDGKIMEAQEKFKKSFESLWQQFNNLNENMIENYSNTCTTLACVNEICDSTNTIILDDYHKTIEENEFLEEKIQSNIDILKNDIDHNMIKNQAIAEQIAVDGHNLIDEIQTNMNNHCTILMQDKLRMENDKKEMEQKFMEDNSSSIGFIENIHHILMEGYNNHVKLVKEKEKKNLQMFIKLGDEIKKQSEVSSDWNDKTTTELHSIQERIGKFLLEDLRRDTPTGLTPARKEYHYPRRLVATSPHERIIQRFREIRNYHENSDDEETTLVNNNSPKKRSQIQT